MTTTTSKKETGTRRFKHPSLAAAMVAFQADLPRVTKNATNPHFKNKYADLAELSNVVIPALAKQGLAWITQPGFVEGVGFALSYTLLHESGEKLTGVYPLTGSTMQQQGSAITYAKRFVLGAVTGVAADDDDDGELASRAPLPPAQGAGFVQQPVDVVDPDLAAAVAACKDLEMLAVLHKQAHERGVLTPAAAALFKKQQQVINANTTAAAGGHSER